MKKLIPFILSLAGLFGSLQAQVTEGTITGTVFDKEGGKPLIGANVVVRGTLVGAATDRNGVFRLRPLPAGLYTLAISVVGYGTEILRDVNVRAGEETRLEAYLRSVAIETEPIVVTAGRREQNPSDVPVSIATVTAAAIAERISVTLDEALRYVPGVNLLQDQVNIRGSTGYSRGVGSRVLLLLDGLPFLTGDTGEINWEAIPTGEIERIEIVKGAGSALYGSSALGGVINVITKNMPDRAETRFRAFSGLYDKPRYEEWDWSEKPRFNSGLIVGHADRLGPIKFLASIARTVDDSYRENDVYHRWNVFSKVQYDISESRDLSMVFNVLERQHGNFFWWRNLKEATIPADAQRNGKVVSRRGNVSIAYKEFISERMFLTVKGMYFGNYWRDDSSGIRGNVSSSNLFQGDVQVTYNPNNDFVVTFGIAGNVDRVRSNLFGNHSGSGFAAYMQEEFPLTGPVRITAGVRYDVQEASSLRKVSRFSPKLATVLSLSDNTSLRASVGWGFRAPSIGELYVSSSTNVTQLLIIPNTQLRAEKSITYEVGMSHNIEDQVALDAALFSNDFSDLIEPLVKVKNVKLNPSDPVGVDRAVAEFDNVTRARIQGGEIGLKIAWFARSLTTDLGYTYVWPHDVGEKKILKFRPRHLFYTATVATIGDVRCSLDYRFVSRIERIDEGLVELAPIIHGDYRVPIHVVDARVSSTFVLGGVPLRAGFNVNNMLNYHYVELIGNLAPVRSYVVVLEGAF